MAPLIPTYEVFFLLEPACKLLRPVGHRLKVLRKPDLPVLGADLFYREETDSALLAVRLDRDRLTPPRYHKILAVAEMAGTPLIDPAKLEDSRRRNFFSLQRDHYFPEGMNLRSVGAALTCLARRVKFAQGSGNLFAANRTREMTKPGLFEPDTIDDVSEFNTRVTSELMTTPARTEVTKAVNPDWNDRVKTVFQRKNASGTNADELVDQNCITVRILRNGMWLPVRLRTLSSKRAYLVTGALPRVGDAVHLALSFGDHSAIVQGTAQLVTSAVDAARTGSAGFALEFPAEETPSRAALVSFLRAARKGGAIIHPPPGRTTMRLPVSWPVRIKHDGKRMQTRALDMSRGGAFLATDMNLQGRFKFEIPLDLGRSLITGEAEVVRSLSTDDATSRGLQQGVGIRFRRFSRPVEESLYRAFLNRVSSRTGKKVVIGADLLRATDLAKSMASLGYVVSFGTDAGMLVEMAENGGVPPDAAIIDDSISVAGLGSSWLEQIYAIRQVPCISAQVSAQDTRLAVDRMLKVDSSI